MIGTRQKSWLKASNWNPISERSLRQIIKVMLPDGSSLSGCPTGSWQRLYLTGWWRYKLSAYLKNVLIITGYSVLCDFGFYIRTPSWDSLHLVFFNNSFTSWRRRYSIWIRVSRKYLSPKIRLSITDDQDGDLWILQYSPDANLCFRLCLYMGWLGTALSFATTYLVLVGSGSEEGIGKTDHMEQWSNLPDRTTSHTDHKGEKMANWYQSMRKESMQVYI